MKQYENVLKSLEKQTDFYFSLKFLLYFLHEMNIISQRDMHRIKFYEKLLIPYL